MNRTQLLGFLKTVLSVRNFFLEKDNQQGVEILHETASGVLKHLGRATIYWSDFSSWEAEFLRSLIREVEGMPEFALRMIDQFLAKFDTKTKASSAAASNNTQSTFLHSNGSMASNN